MKDMTNHLIWEFKSYVIMIISSSPLYFYVVEGFKRLINLLGLDYTCINFSQFLWSCILESIFMRKQRIVLSWCNNNTDTSKNTTIFIYFLLNTITTDWSLYMTVCSECLCDDFDLNLWTSLFYKIWSNMKKFDPRSSKMFENTLLLSIITVLYWKNICGYLVKKPNPWKVSLVFLWHSPIKSNGKKIERRSS